MFLINTSTKKFTEAVSLDLGQLPTVDTRIDFQLTDGNEPVEAEGKQFAMTIGTVAGTLYKTDEDTVSFRYLKFDDSNVASTLAITMEMDGVEILNDTISLTYQEAGGGGSITVDTALSSSSPNPVANATLTPIINGKADSATTLAGYGITDAYTKTELATVATTGDYDDLTNKPALPDDNDYLCIEVVEHPLNIAKANRQITFVLKSGTAPANPPNLEYSYDKAQWTPVTINSGISLATSDMVYFRGDNNALASSALQTGGYAYGFSTNAFRHRVYGNAMSLLDKTCQSTTIGAWALYQLFKSDSYLVSAGGMKLPSLSVPEGAYAEMFMTCVNLEDVPELPATSVEAYGYISIFRYCSLVSHIKVGFTAWPNGDYATGSWVMGVSYYGVFEAPSALPYVVGDSKVPSGWAYNPPADETDYFCVEKSSTVATDQIRIVPVNTPTNTIAIEYSYDKVTWTSMTISPSGTGPWIQLTNQNPKVYLRGDNATINKYSDVANGGKHFAIQGNSTSNVYNMTGNIMSLIDKTCRRDDVPDGCFSQLFCYTNNSVLYITLSVDSDIRLPARRVGSLGYAQLFWHQPNITRLTELGGREWGTNACVAMFEQCPKLEVVPSEMHIVDVQANAFRFMFYGCTKLKSTPCIVFDRGFAPVTNWGYAMFGSCSNLSTVTVRGGYYHNGSNWLSWFGTGFTDNWLDGVSSNGTAVGDWIKRIPSRGTSTAPSSWGISYASNDGELATTDTIDTGTLQAIDQYYYKTIYPNPDKTLIIKAYNGYIALSVASMPQSQIAYAGVVIDYATGANIAYDSNRLTLADTLVEGKRNHCVVRWCNGQAKLFVVDTEDIPQA